MYTIYDIYIYIYIYIYIIFHTSMTLLNDTSLSGTI